MRSMVEGKWISVTTRRDDPLYDCRYVAEHVRCRNSENTDVLPDKP
jgi:hypothetical protein